MGPKEKKKLLIVDDSAFMRKLIADFFQESERIEVVGIARNGKDAIRKINMLQPDVVTLDVEMPEMNGMDALKEIMEHSPLPVVMLSSTTQSGTVSTLQAMEYGAVDFVAKPSGTISLDLHKIKEELLLKVEQAANVPIAKLQKNTSIPKIFTPNLKVEPILPKTKPVRDWDKRSKKIVLIGTSTGGPRALQEVITKLPKEMKAPILIVQHMPAGFTKSLAERLNHLAKIDVKEAENGDILRDGHAYIAPGGYHLRIQKTGSVFSIVLDNIEPPRVGHRPSVDVLFEDVSKLDHLDKLAVIMTGMGSDGARGLQKLNETGNVIAIAESAKTSIVYGMPKAAVETNLVQEVVDLENIAQAIIQYLP